MREHKDGNARNHKKNAMLKTIFLQSLFLFGEVFSSSLATEETEVISQNDAHVLPTT